MSVFFNDLFTEASTTALSAHTSDSGHTWAYFGFNNTHVPNIFTSFGGVVGSSAASATMWRSTGISGTSADAVVTADVRVDTVGTNFTAYGLGARLNSGGTSGYLCYYNRANGFWRLERITGAGLTLVTLADSAAQTYTAGTNITVVLEVSGVGASVSITLKVNGTTLITYSDTAAGRVTAIGYVGFYTQANGNGLGWFTNSMSADDVVGGGDTTAPTLTSVSGTDTGSTSATVSVSSTEAGPGWAVLTPTSTQPNQAQVEAGQDHTGSTTGVFLDTATLAIGSNPGAFVFTGLTPGATYWPHVVSKDTATPTANVSLVESGPSFTMPAPDLIDPVFAGGTTLNAGTKTNSSIALSTSAVATDNIAVTGYEWSSDNGATYPFTSLTNSFTFTALADLTSYNFRVRAYDGAGNRSAPLSLTTSTYRAGDTAANVIANTAAVGGNPAGVLYALALTLDPDDWMAYREIAAPDPAGGTLTPNANGSFTYVGPEPADWIIQPEVNGVDHADGTITVALYQTIVEDTTAPTLTSPTGAGLGSTGASGSVSTNEANGTLYWLTNTSATATDAAIKAANSQAVTATGVQFVTSSGLTASTTYYNHFLHRDAAGNDSARSTSASFATPAAPSGGGPKGSVVVAQIAKPICRPIVRPMT